MAKDKPSIKSKSVERRSLIGNAIIDGLLKPGGIVFTEGGDYNQGIGGYTQSGGGDHTQEGGDYNQSAVKGNLDRLAQVSQVTPVVQGIPGLQQ